MEEENHQSTNAAMVVTEDHIELKMSSSHSSRDVRETGKICNETVERKRELCVIGIAMIRRAMGDGKDKRVKNRALLHTCGEVMRA